MSNTELWERHRTPPKDACKKFHSGRFGGTAIDPMWLILEATKEWGPIGGDWNYITTSEKIEHLAESWVLHTIVINLLYPGGSLESTGNTWLVWTQNDGKVIYDDEASKKSRTDAISKALSWLGFGADVHMGIFDGNKYADLFGKKEWENITEPAGDEWSSPDIPDDILDVVQENYKIMKKREGGDNTRAWHGRVLPNFLGIHLEDKDNIVETIKALSKENLLRLSTLQNDKLKFNKGD